MDPTDDGEFQETYDTDYNNNDVLNFDLQILSTFATVIYRHDMEEVTLTRFGKEKLRVYHDRAVLNALEIISEIKPLANDELLRVKDELDQRFNEANNSQTGPPVPHNSKNVNQENQTMIDEQLPGELTATTTLAPARQCQPQNHETNENEENEPTPTTSSKSSLSSSSRENNHVGGKFSGGTANEYTGAVTNAKIVRQESVHHEGSTNITINNYHVFPSNTNSDQEIDK